jgi:hypothetical protein
MLVWVGDSDVIGALGTPAPPTVAIIDAASTSDGLEKGFSCSSGLFVPRHRQCSRGNA